MYFHNQLIILYSSSPYILSFFLTILFNFVIYTSTRLIYAHAFTFFYPYSAFSQAQTKQHLNFYILGFMTSYTSILHVGILVMHIDKR